MPPKGHRITRALFAELLGSRNFSNSPHFSLRTAHSTAVRLGVSVSKKVSKKAVVRNLVRRRAYALMSRFLKDLRPGLYLLSAKPGAEKISGAELEKELKMLTKV